MASPKFERLHPDSNAHYSDGDGFDYESLCTDRVKDVFGTTWFIVNIILSGLVTFGVNVGMSYLIMNGHERIGVWEQPRSSQNGEYVSSNVMFDAWLSIFLTSFCGCLATSLVPLDVKKGKVRPLRPCVRHRRIILWLFPGVSLDSVFKRALVFAIEVSVISSLTGLLILQACGISSMPAINWIYGKSTWCALSCVVQYPFIIVAALCVGRIPRDCLDGFRDNYDGVLVPSNALIRQNSTNYGAV